MGYLRCELNPIRHTASTRANGSVCEGYKLDKSPPSVLPKGDDPKLEALKRSSGAGGGVLMLSASGIRVYSGRR